MPGFIVSLGQRLESWVTYIDCFLIVCLLIKEKPLSYLMITHKKMRKLLAKTPKEQFIINSHWCENQHNHSNRPKKVLELQRKHTKIDWFVLMSPSTRRRSRKACFRRWGCQHNDCSAVIEQSSKKGMFLFTVLILTYFLPFCNILI